MAYIAKADDQFIITIKIIGFHRITKQQNHGNR